MIRISDMIDAALPLSGDELIELSVPGSPAIVTRKARVQDIADLAGSPAAGAARLAAQRYRYLTVFGDSISLQSTVSGASSAGTSSTALLGSKAGRTLNAVQAESGAMTNDIADNVFGVSISGNNLSSRLMIGTNDVRTIKTTAYWQGVYQSSLQALAAYLALPATGRINGSAASLVGTWTDPAIWGGIVRSCAATSGTRTATFTPVIGSVLYLCMIAQHPNSSTYTIHVDGVQWGGTFSTSPGGTITSINGLNYAPILHRITGLSPGAHTIVVTVTAAAASNPVYVVWAHGNQFAAGDTVPPQLLISKIPYYTVAGNGTYGTTDAMFDTFNAMIGQVYSELSADGLRVALSDASNVLDRSTEYADGVHPNDAGHAVLAQLWADDLLEWI